MNDHRTPVHVVSDGTGNTVQTVLKAALRQFDEGVVKVRVFGGIDREEKLDGVFEDAAKADAVVVTTLVRQPMREHAIRLAQRLGVRHVDVLGPLIGALEGSLDRRASGVPGLLHRADERYYRRVDAIEFTVHADDGKDPRRLLRADIILLGVSRTGKTPLSTYLAHKGFRVGNQPIVLDRPVPPQLFDVDPRRIIALTIDPLVLQQIRKSRMLSMRMEDDTGYSDMGYILAELEYADRLYRGNRWPVVDVTNRAIEETAAEVLGLLAAHDLVDETGDASQLG